MKVGDINLCPSNHYLKGCIREIIEFHIEEDFEFHLDRFRYTLMKKCSCQLSKCENYEEKCHPLCANVM